jgi:hypothetical protein
LEECGVPLRLEELQQLGLSPCAGLNSPDARIVYSALADAVKARHDSLMDVDSGDAEKQERFSEEENTKMSFSFAEHCVREVERYSHFVMYCPVSAQTRRAWTSHLCSPLSTTTCKIVVPFVSRVATGSASAARSHRTRR